MVWAINTSTQGDCKDLNLIPSLGAGLDGHLADVDPDGPTDDHEILL